MELYISKKSKTAYKFQLQISLEKYFWDGYISMHAIFLWKHDVLSVLPEVYIWKVLIISYFDIYRSNNHIIVLSCIVSESGLYM